MRTELIQHIIDTIVENDMQTFEDLHHEAFNADYYVIGYYNAEQWLARHNLSAFDAIAYVIEQQQIVFGEVTLTPTDINAETVVNQYVYFMGQEILSEFDLNQEQADLLQDLNEAL